jgi:hypothetical protein
MIGVRNTDLAGVHGLDHGRRGFLDDSLCTPVGVVTLEAGGFCRHFSGFLAFGNFLAFAGKFAFHNFLDVNTLPLSISNLGFDGLADGHALADREVFADFVGGILARNPSRLPVTGSWCRGRTASRAAPWPRIDR